MSSCRTRASYGRTLQRGRLFSWMQLWQHVVPADLTVRKRTAGILTCSSPYIFPSTVWRRAPKQEVWLTVFIFAAMCTFYLGKLYVSYVIYGCLLRAQYCLLFMLTRNDKKIFLNSHTVISRP